jgi:hypothetical protein
MDSNRRRAPELKACARPGCPETFVSSDRRKRYHTPACGKHPKEAEVFRAARADRRAPEDEEAQVRRAVEALREDVPVRILRERFTARILAKAMERAPEALHTSSQRLPMGPPP